MESLHTLDFSEVTLTLELSEVTLTLVPLDPTLTLLVLATALLEFPWALAQAWTQSAREWML